jgi:glycerol-3-phosphate dehydrogenase subunit B
MTQYSGRKYDLIVIGSGLAGTAAACFAVTRGLAAAQVSATGGEMTFASGMLDLLALHPTQQQKLWDDPWAGIADLINSAPQHPYARVGVDGIRASMSEFLAFMDSIGLDYRGIPDRNLTLATAAGTLKTTYRVPKSMWGGVVALDQRVPTLLVDFEGMKDFSAGMMVEVLRSRWPGLRALRIPCPLPFPGVDRHNLLLADAIESEEVRRALADAIRPHLAGAQQVGMPSVLGVRSTARIVADLEERLGVGIFEIPTLPPSVPGLRMREALDAALLARGAQLLGGRQVIETRADGRRCAGITVGASEWRETIEADGVILATGRFLGGGLAAGRTGIVETVFGLPVVQPQSRSLWHCEQFLDNRGHAINQAGLAIDDQFRPLGADGGFAFENLFAAGSVLAHQDWVRTKSGAGLAIATAYGAVGSFLRYRVGVSRQKRPQ